MRFEAFDSLDAMFAAIEAAEPVMRSGREQSIKMFEEYVQDAQEGEGIPMLQKMRELADELIGMVKNDNARDADAHGYLGDRRDKAKEIGLLAWTMMESDGMHYLYNRVCLDSQAKPFARTLEYAWDGVGDWLA